MTHRTTLVGRSATDVILDLVEFANPSERLAGDRRWSGHGQFIEAPAHVCPAEGERHAAFVGQHTIAAIAVDLKDSGEAREMSDRTLGLSVRRIDIGDARRVAPFPWSVIAGIGPELTCLSLAAAGIEHWRGRLVGEEFWRGLQLAKQPLVDRTQVPGGAADPIGERGAIEIDSLPGVDLRLAIRCCARNYAAEAPVLPEFQAIPSNLRNIIF
ncbi:hypothetical protein X767_32715 [Mesorhizobium sp. LSJC264A00]|nr:hypothetical protein X767_32715 [Mesorhizobium sp. LSJC264A00]